MSTTPPSPTSVPAEAPRRAALRSLDEALAALLADLAPVCAAEPEVLPTSEALGRVLAADVVSLLDVPPADNTSMDGYAMRAADVPAEGTVLPVSQRIPAGHVGEALQPGTLARIFTGAQVPAGADAVVMQEVCEALPDGTVRVNQVPTPGQWVRRRAEDVARGAVVLAAGTRLTPAALGLAASVGAATLAVARRPRVAVFSTGDELVMPGEVAPEAMRPGAIYNSNRYTLRGLLQALGCEVDDLGIVPDRREATRAALREAAAGHDLIVTSGGVSAGEEDHLKPAVEAEGRLSLWQVAMKPGKPLAFGAVRRPEGAGEAAFIGLPGNPVSVFVTFLLTVRPLLLALQGVPAAQATRLPALPLPAGFDWPRPDRRREFVRARVGDDGRVVLFPNQSSGVLTSAVWAEGLVDIAAGQAITAGETVRFIPLAALN